MTETIEDQRQAFVNRTRSINDFCLEYGCFFSVAWLTGIEAAYLEACIAELKSDQPGAAHSYQIINDWFTALEYRPFSRAYFMYRALKTPFVQDFSHHLERGLLHYYKGDYFSAVQVLATAVEGILRLYVGGKPKEIGKVLLDKIQHVHRPLPYPEFAPRHSLFRDIFERFLRKWFFAQSDDPALEVIPSRMNRNYIAHLAGTDAFYRPSDCNRLFACFDVMLEIITLEFKELDQFLNLRKEDIPEVNERSNYYASLIAPWSPLRPIRDREEQLMSQNPSYESNPALNLLAQIMTLHEWEQAALAELARGVQPTIHTLPPGRSS